MALGWLTKAFTKTAQEPWEKDRDDFFKAIKKNKVEQIKEIAARYPNEALGWKTENGSPLYVAHENRRLDAFKALVGLGADINENYTFGKGMVRTPLLRAIDRKEQDFLEFIVDSGADLEKQSTHGVSAMPFYFHYKYTPLGVAIKNGNETALKLLLSKGADPKAPCYNCSNEGTPTLTTIPEAFAEEQKKFKMADIIRRAALNIPAQQATSAQATVNPVGVMQPLKLKKSASAQAGMP